MPIVMKQRRWRRTAVSHAARLLASNNFNTNVIKMSRINLYKAPSAAHIVMFIAGSMFTAGIIHGSLLSSGEFEYMNGAQLWLLTNALTLFLFNKIVLSKSILVIYSFFALKLWSIVSQAASPTPWVWSGRRPPMSTWSSTRWILSLVRISL